MLHAVFLPSVWGIILLIWGIEMTDGKTYHQPYSTISHYTCSLTLPDDETTHITITTKTSGVAFASSPQDALAQTITSNEYSKSSYASYILRYVRDQLMTIDVDDADLIYTDDPTITPMTDEDLHDFQRDVISANG
jgi:hypothetical protein